MINIINMNEEQYYSIEEVAKMLKVAYLTVYRWIQSKKLPAIKAGKQYRIRKIDLENFTRN
jgi:putative molybdopterin biosynthesis protein